jgi:RimJ/RimL family protein N-acetyltransferase
MNNNITLSDLSIKFHLHDLSKITKNISIMKYIGNGKPWDFNKTKRFIEYGNSDDYYYKAIINNNKIIGVIGIYKRNSIFNLLIFISKNDMKKGYGSSALKLFLQIIDIPVYADVLSDNIASINFFIKNNYKYKIIDNIYRFKIM